MAALLTRKELERQFAPSFTPDQTTVLVDVFDSYNALEVERASDTRAIREGQRVLTDGQRVLTEKVDVLADAVLGLTEAQTRTDVQLKSLTEAQARTDVQLKSLTEAQARTEATMERGFAAVWGAISELTAQMSTLGQHVGSLVNTFGLNLEEYTGALLPAYLDQQFDITGAMLERRYFQDVAGATDEVDLYGHGLRDGATVVVLAEVKTSIGGTEARRLADKLDRVAAATGEAEVLKLIVAMNIHPTAVEAVADRDIILLPYSRIRL